MPELFNTNAAAVATSPVDTEEVEAVEVDWDAEIKVEHPDADLNAIQPIPPAGVYLWKVRLQQVGEGKENPYGSVTKNKQQYLNVLLELELVDESSPFNGFKINEKVSSIKFDKRETSMLHHVMNCLGETLPEVIRMRDLRDRVIAVLESSPSPMIPAELEWRAARKSGPGKYDWEDIAKKMRDFPKDKESDGYSQTYIYTNPTNKQKSEHRAIPYIAKYILQGQ